MREALGAAVAVVLGGGARLANLGAEDDDTDAVEDDAVEDEFGVGSALADVSSVFSLSSVCAGSTPSDARCTASFIISSAFSKRVEPATQQMSSKRNLLVAIFI